MGQKGQKKIVRANYETARKSKLGVIKEAFNF